MANTGNINYSLNKNQVYKILTGSIIYLIPHYYILTIISLVYIFSIKYKKYFFANRNELHQKETNTMHFFKSITYGSPFGILNLSEDNKEKDKYVGLSNNSYLIIIISYIITYLVILEGLMRNVIYSIYVSIIQTNPNNNPYKNVNCITKISDNPHKSYMTNYSAIISLSLIFLVPFIIPFLIKFLKFDNYDIKHILWFRYVILILILFPIFMIIVSKASFYKKLQIFPDINKFIEQKDYDFVKNISKNFNFKIFNIIAFLFVVFVFCFYTIVYADFRYDIKKKIIVYVTIFIILFIFIPFFIALFSLSNSFINDYKNNFSGDIITDIQNNGVSDLYEMLVKYNYPCFYK
jgi:hypothetical protein